MENSASDTSEESSQREARYSDFVGMLTRHDQAIRRFVRSLLPSGDGVDDVMQDTALECWKKFDEFQPDSIETAVGEFVRWACVIARYKALSWQRDRSRDRLVFRESVVERLAASAMQNVDGLDTERKSVYACLAKMRTEQRRILLSIYSPGESVAHIAAETGQKARKLYSRVTLLRKWLLNCVQQRLSGDGGHA